MNPDNISLALMAFLTVWQVGKSILRFVAPRTDSKVDDSLVAAMDSAERKLVQVEESEWVRENGPAFWAQVEAISETEIPALKGVGKLAYYLGIAHQAYVAMRGKGLSPAGVKQLEIMAAGLSASQKVGIQNRSSKVVKT